MLASGKDGSPERLVVVKLGGSVLTRKRQAARLRPKLLRRLATEIAHFRGQLIVLHGAGSVGHPAAKRFGLARPPEPAVAASERARGAAIVSAEVRRLHLAVLAALVDAGTRPWSVPPATIAVQEEGRLRQLEEGPVREALARGLVPVAFGDVVPDEAWGFSILSADTIAVELARRLGAERVVFVSDVPGIYDPARPQRDRIVESVTEELVAGLSGEGAGPDVTGGIRAKAQAMLAVARGGCDAGLISGLTDGALSRALRGEPVYGSWCKAGSR